MKKFLVLLIMLMTAALLTCAAAEERPTVYTSGDYKYVLLEDGTAEIHYYAARDARKITELTIPTELDGYRVASIGNNAFSLGSALTSITIPDGITSIGDRAFVGCFSLTSITIPNSITSISATPLRSGRGLTRIIVSADHPTLATIDGVLFEKKTKTLIFYPSAFTAASYTIPQGVQCIGESAFAHCALESVTIPDSVTTISDSAFYQCEYLDAVAIADSVTSIGDSAFTDCLALNSITIPNSVTSIGDSAFFHCKRLESVTIPESVISIGTDAFSQCAYYLSFNVIRHSYADEWALANGFTCTYVKPTGLPYGDLTYRLQGDGTVLIVYCETTSGKLEIPAVIDGAPVTSIRAYAFAGGSTLAGVTIPDSVTSIDENAFKDCSYVTLTVGRDSYARQYCIDNGLPYTYPDANDWLLN